jgi:hypothetical protein
LEYLALPGWGEASIYLGYTAFDEVTGEEVERIEALPCRRCTEEGR